MALCMERSGEMRGPKAPVHQVPPEEGAKGRDDRDRQKDKGREMGAHPLNPGEGMIGELIGGDDCRRLSK